MAELPRATFDGSSLTIGTEQTVPQGQYKTRVNVGSKFAFVYQNNTKPNEFIGVVPGRYWFELPATINKRNTTQIKSYVTSVLNAPEPVTVPANLDDSYSLRDITEFKTNVATVTINGNHEWVDENSVKLSANTIFQFNPKAGWAATFTVDDETLTVTPGQNLTTMGRANDTNLVTMDALQFVAQDGSFEVYRGDFKTSSTEQPIAYYGAYQLGDRQTIEEFSNSIGSAQLVKNADNAVTGATGEYLVFVTRGAGDSRRIGYVDTASSEFVPFTGLEQAKEFYDNYVNDLKAAEIEEAARLAAAQDDAREGTVIGSISRGNRIYNIEYAGDNEYFLKTSKGLLVAVYTANSDEEALVMAEGRTDAYEAEYLKRSETSWGVIVAAVVGVSAIMALIIWLRMRKEA